MSGQKAIVLDHLINEGGITSFEAFERYGITRLAAVIHDLKDIGVQIVSIPDFKYDSKGRVVKRWALYKLGAKRDA